MLDSWEDVKRVVHYQGQSDVLEVIQIKPISRYHNKENLALIQLKNLLPSIKNIRRRLLSAFYIKTDWMKIVYNQLMQITVDVSGHL